MGRNRDTRNLDAEELAKLARASAEADVTANERAGTPDKSRTSTVHDPLTMALLAEVARNARTEEFDPTELAKDLDEAPPALPHPNLKRR